MDSMSSPEAASLEAEYIQLLLGLADRAPDRQTLVSIVDSIVRALDCERAFLFVVRKTGGFRSLVARTSDREDIGDALDRMSHFAIGRMLSSGQIFTVADARKDRRFRTVDSSEGRRAPLSIQVYPLTRGEEVVGGIYIDHRLRAIDVEQALQPAAQRWVALASLALAQRELAARVRSLEKHAARPIVDAGEPHASAGAGVDSAESQISLAELARRELVDFHGLESSNADVLDIFDTARNLRGSDIPILICGETGAGKGRLAQAVHRASQRSGAPFVTVACGSIPETLVESELLGHAQGAFTGAERDRVGLLEQAHRGTLFLDEVGDLGEGLQKILLRFLEDGVVRPLGAKESCVVDTRIIAATSQRLESLVESGRLREDLFFRLKGVELDLPPLRERWEDIPALALRLFASACPEGASPSIDDAALEWLLSYLWPGNVRELENEMRRLGAVGVTRIEASDLSPQVRGRARRAGPSAGSERLEEVVARAEREAVEAALVRTGGNKSLAAAELGITRKSLYRRLSKYGLDRKVPRTVSDAESPSAST